MSKPWIFVSPSSRGIGHALTRHLLRTTRVPVLATSRSDPTAARAALLEGLATRDGSTGAAEEAAAAEKMGDRLHVVGLDVTDEASVRTAADRAAELFPPRTHHLRLGFALPGILRPEKSPRQVDYGDALQTLQVNTLGPLVLMKWFGEFLPRKGTDLSLPAPRPSGGGGHESRAEDEAGAIAEEKEEEEREEGGGAQQQQQLVVDLPPHAVWLSMSARVGSTTDNRLGGWYSYRASKAGVNSLTKTFDLYLQTRSAEKAMAVAYHPGTVKTGLSREFWANVKEEKLFSPDFAVDKLVGVVTSRAIKDRGKCWDWKGDEIPP